MMILKIFIKQLVLKQIFFIISFLIDCCRSVFSLSSSKRTHTIQHQIQHNIHHHTQQHIRKYKKIVFQYLLSNSCPQKYFYTRHLTQLLHFQEKFAFSIADAFRIIYFLLHFYQFLRGMRCDIFHVNTNLLIIQRNVNIFAQETIYPSIVLEKNWSSPSQTFFDTSTFYHFFTIFKSE